LIEALPLVVLPVLNERREDHKNARAGRAMTEMTRKGTDAYCVPIIFKIGDRRLSSTRNRRPPSAAMAQSCIKKRREEKRDKGLHRSVRLETTAIIELTVKLSQPTTTPCWKKNTKQ
jgi:hypothetical protein